MANVKPSDHGIVVENKESGVRFASTDANFDPASERKIRDLHPGETILGYVPRRKSTTQEHEESLIPEETTTPSDSAGQQ